MSQNVGKRIIIQNVLVDPEKSTSPLFQAQNILNKRGIQCKIELDIYLILLSVFYLEFLIVKLRQGSGKDRQGMAVKAKGLKA